MLRISRLISILLSACLVLASNPAAVSVENGVVVQGDENAVYLFDGTGNAFLYSPYIVFTAAHGIPFWDKRNLTVRNSNGQSSEVEKILISPEYKERIVDRKSIENGTSINSRYRDFAILILKTPLSMRKKVSLISPSELNQIISNKSQVYMVGFSFHNSTRKIDGLARRLTGELISPEEAKNIFDSYLRDGHPNWAPKQATYELGPINLVQSEFGGSGCDGDSGSGVYVLRGDEKIYLGPYGSHSMGVKNCGDPGFWGPTGNVSNIEPVFNHLDLISSAESYVTEKIAKEREAKQRADSERPKKKTIVCVKGKQAKKVTSINPKCPKGYTKK